VWPTAILVSFLTFHEIKKITNLAIETKISLKIQWVAGHQKNLRPLQRQWKCPLTQWNVSFGPCFVALI